MSLPNPPSSRSTPARTSTAATVPPYQPSGLDAFSSADEEEDWSEPSGSALDKFATESDGAARQSPTPPLARHADDSGVGARLSPVAVYSPFQPESRLTTTPVETPAGSARLLPVRPRAPLMDRVPIVDAEIVQSTELARTSTNLPAPIPVPTLPIHERLLNAGEPFARIASDALGRLLAYRRQSPFVSVLIVVGALEAVAIVWLTLGAISGPVGAVTVTSEPVGARLFVDGTPSGETPTTLKLLEGQHTLELRSAGPSEVLVLNVSQGADVSRYFELSSGTSPARMQVVTKPAGAWISVDGRVRGQSPLLVEDLNPGSHTVRFERGGYAIERAVTLRPGSDTTTEVRLDTERPQAASGHGLLMIASPIALQAFEGERLIGTSEASPWQLPAGRHDITLVNSSIGFRLTKPVDIEARQTTGLELRLTPATLSIDVPAETDLSIDGVAAGVGPLTQRAIAPGQHDIVARHPEFGERRVRVTLAVGVPVSLKIDFGR